MSAHMKSREHEHEYGANRIMLGSDYPWVSPSTLLDYVQEWNLPLDVEEAILGKNAALLLQL